MPRLILMRHAKSSWDAPHLSDHDRPLNKRGREAARRLGNWLRREGFEPDGVLCSTSERTGETFLGLAIDAPVTFDRRLYHASAETMLATLRKATARTILMIGHNPGIADFADRLLEAAPDHHRFHDYPTGATLVADFPGTHWPDTTWGTGKEVAFTIPRDLSDDSV